MLVDNFPHQALDFFGAVRAQIYNEQISHFIHSVGIENVSRNVVNALTPPTFRKPNFALSHLIEVGDRLVREQRRVDDMRLANEYNRVLQPGSAATPGPFYRAYEPPTLNGSFGSGSSGPADTQPTATADNGNACPLPSPPPPAASPQSSTLAPDLREQIHTLLSQGYRLAVEHVDQSRFRTNVWQSGPPLPCQDAATATAALEQCLGDYAQDYVRLIGIDPRTKRRVVEHMIPRP